ncbi:MAG TPA: hypothetical protein VK489_16425 [Ferruginibacter sp.]|nr:hypothetical protein [Ferruginibacter sp.]
MKILIIIPGLINGCYMLIDGIYVILKGKYIGPEKPGPWANLFYKLDIDVFKLGPLFIIFGLGWLAFILSAWTNQSWAWMLGLIISLLTVWYLPVGTLLSLIVFVVLLFYRQKLGL